jgi:hypothetical protein
MQLQPLDAADLPRALAQVRAHMPAMDMACAVLDRIAASRARIPFGVDLPVHRQQAIRLAHACGIATLDEEPQAAFSYDGCCIRSRCEASVLIHEVAHWLLAPKERRSVADFGLGAGPETGRREEAEAARVVDQAGQIEEEALASLLGILWEEALGQPAILAFLEQNWLDDWHRPEACAANLRRNLQLLRQRGLIDAKGRPLSADSCAKEPSLAS